MLWPFMTFTLKQEIPTSKPGPWCLMMSPIFLISLTHSSHPIMAPASGAALTMARQATRVITSLNILIMKYTRHHRSSSVIRYDQPGLVLGQYRLITFDKGRQPMMSTDVKKIVYVYLYLLDC